MRSVATVIPEIGFDDDPISPVRRDDTVTKRNPRITMSSAAMMRAIEPVPPAATAPAPMYRMYALRIAPGDMSLMRRVVSGASGAARPLPKNLIAGISTRYASTPPAHMIDAMRGPMM